MTKKDTMKTRTDQELIKLLSDTRETLRTERFSAAGARAKNPNAKRNHRVAIARVLTEQRSRELKAA
ncbi:MAG: 50S ribosomal protein L29 [Patescibacteria group bacterium]